MKAEEAFRIGQKHQKLTNLGATDLEGGTRWCTGEADRSYACCIIGGTKIEAWGVTMEHALNQLITAAESER